MSIHQETRSTRWQPTSIAICGLLALAAVSFAVASVIHFGAAIDLGPVKVRDPFPGAAMPELIIAIVLAIGLLSVLAHWAARWRVAFAATLFALLVTIYGMTITLSTTRTGDITYHVSVLVLLGVILAILLLPAGRHSLSA